MCDTFQLMFVGMDTNKEVSRYDFSLYESSETEAWIEAFNQYMQSEEGHDAANYIGYENFPEGKLTFAYIAENEAEVAEMINVINGNIDYSSKFTDGIKAKYEEITGTDGKEEN